MELKEIESALMERLESTRGWDYFRSPFVRNEYQNLGVLFGGLAQAVGVQKVLFAELEVSDDGEVNGFPILRVLTTVLSERGFSFLTMTVGENQTAPASIDWLPLSAVASLKIETKTSAWSESFNPASLALHIGFKTGKSITLSPTRMRFNTYDELLEVIQFLQVHAEH